MLLLCVVVRRSKNDCRRIFGFASNPITPPVLLLVILGVEILRVFDGCLTNTVQSCHRVNLIEWELQEIVVAKLCRYCLTLIVDVVYQCLLMLSIGVRWLSSWRVASSPSLFPTLCSRQATASTALVADREIVGGGRTTESPWLSPSIWEDVGSMWWMRGNGWCSREFGVRIWCQQKDTVRWMSVQYKSSLNRDFLNLSCIEIF
jgi:hypothetical protein